MKKKPLTLLCAAGGFIPLSLAAQYDTNLIGYWPFENDLIESSGVHAGGLHDGTAIGTIAYGAGPTGFGSGLLLDGTNGVTVNNSRLGEANYATTFDGGVSGAISISFWAKGLPASWSPFIAKRGEVSDGYQVRRLAGSGNGTFTLRDTAGVDDPQGTISIAAGQPVWNHYVATWDGSTRKLYVNGVEDLGVTQTGDTAVTGPGNAVNYWLTFGMRHNNADPATFQNFFNGELDDMAIWNRALSSQEAYQLGLAPLSDILLETDADGDGLFASQEATFGTLDSDTDSDDDGVSDFDEFVKGGDGTTDDDFDMDGLTNLEETSGSENPFGPGETTDWCVADSDGDGINDGDELGSGNGSITNPNNTDTDGDGFSDSAELAESSDPTDPSSVPPITTGLVGYWEFENDLVETSNAHAAGTHDAATTDMFPEVYGTGPTIAVDGVLSDFGSSLNTVADDNGTPVPYGVYVLGSNSSQSGYVNTFDAGIGNEFSVSLWAKGWPARWSPFISKKGEANEGFQIRRQDNTANATFTLHQTAGAIDPIGSEGSSSGQPLWRHYLGTWNGSTGERKLYVDGVLAWTETGDFETGDVGAATAYWLTFGARHNNGDSVVTSGDVNDIFTNVFSGEIDDVAFWHRSLKSTEAAQLAAAPLSFVMTQIDTDQDGLFASQEDAFGTLDTNPDTDGDGVGDLEEFNKGSNGAVDDDPDMDGLVNSQETSGSANPWVGGVNVGTPGTETTDWCAADSDLDGINDGDEISAINGSVTDPNNPDTDGDGFSDGSEVAASTDPLDNQSTPTEWRRDLCGYWKFDGDLTDSEFLGADGVMQGLGTTEVYATGQFGQAIDLTKADEQRVEISGDENYFDSVGGDLTVSAWVQIDAFDQNWQAIISKGDTPTDWRMARYDNTPGAGFVGGAADLPADPASVNPPINDGSWHHIVGVARNGVSSSLWVDGVLVETKTSRLPLISDSVNSVLIGGNPDTAGDAAGAFRTWAGNIDDVAVWKRALTDNEVTTLFYNGNDLQFIIDNDVTPTDPPVVAEVEIAAVYFDVAGDFNVDVTGLNENAAYQMKRSLLLDGTDWVDVGTPFAGLDTNTFIDPDPIDKAFYQIFELIAE